MLKKCKACDNEISDDVKKCPHCGKDCRNWFAKHKIITFIGCLVLLSILGNVSKVNNTSKTPVQSVQEKQEGQVALTAEKQPTPTPEPVITVDAGDLIKAFDDNEIRANSQYKDKQANITGKVMSINEILGSTTVSLGTDEFSVVNVSCYFTDKNEISKIEKLNKGDNITVNGRINGKAMDVIVKKCVIKG
jgi:hypothetical protein